MGVIDFFVTVKRSVMAARGWGSQFITVDWLSDGRDEMTLD